MNISWDVEVSVAVTEPDADDVLVVARNGVDALVDLLTTDTAVVTVTKTVSDDGRTVSRETWNVDLDTGRVSS